MALSATPPVAGDRDEVAMVTEAGGGVALAEGPPTFITAVQQVRGGRLHRRNHS